MCDTWIYNLPKVELHCHLDGSLAVDTVRELAQRAQIEVPSADNELKELVEADSDCHDLNEYLEKFRLPLALLQTEEALAYAAFALMRDASKENVMYIELRFAPLSCIEKGLSVRQAVSGVLRGMKQGESVYGIKSRLILCAMRHNDVDENIIMIQEAQEFLGLGVCAVDLAGNESDFPPMLQRKFFETAKDMGYEVTIHAGECQNAQNVLDAISLGAKRVGHGIAVMNHKDALSKVIKNQICLEMCPSSNLQTKAVSSLDEYPLYEFLKEGVCVTINTDNRMVTGTTLSREYESMKVKYNLTNEEMILITKNAIQSAFVCDAEKKKMLKTLMDYSTNKK